MGEEKGSDTYQTPLCVLQIAIWPAFPAASAPRTASALNQRGYARIFRRFLDGKMRTFIIRFGELEYCRGVQDQFGLQHPINAFCEPFALTGNMIMKDLAQVPCSDPSSLPPLQARRLGYCRRCRLEANSQSGSHFYSARKYQPSRLWQSTSARWLQCADISRRDRRWPPLCFCCRLRFAPWRR